MGKDFETTIAYWGDQGAGRLPEGFKETLLGHKDDDLHKALIRDIRGHESDYHLDTNGFEVHSLPPKAGRDANIPFGDDSEYFEEVSNLIKTITGARRVFVWGKIIRQYARDALKPHEFIPGKVQGPSPKAHIDLSPDTVEDQMCGSFPEMEDEIKKSSRWQVLGIWRPIKQIQRDPLILADARTIPDSDYVNLARENDPGQGVVRLTSMIRNSNEREHRWYYWSDMMPEDVLVFKHFDSQKDLPAWRCGHTSVEIPGTANLPPRESFECRAIVIY